MTSKRGGEKGSAEDLEQGTARPSLGGSSSSPKKDRPSIGTASTARPSNMTQPLMSITTSQPIINDLVGEPADVSTGSAEGQAREQRTGLTTAMVEQLFQEW